MEISLIQLPNELLFLIATWLSVSDLGLISQTCIQFRQVFNVIMRIRVNKLPWRVTVDFSRDRSHHIVLHSATIKLGWFYRSHLVEEPEHIKNLVLESCNQCQTSKFYRRKYVIIYSGFGGPFLDQLIQYGHQVRIRMTRGYYPIILGLTEKDSHDTTELIITPLRILGLDLQYKDEIPLFESLEESTRHEIYQHSRNQILCDSDGSPWIQI